MVRRSPFPLSLLQKYLPHITDKPKQSFKVIEDKANIGLQCTVINYRTEPCAQDTYLNSYFDIQTNVNSQIIYMYHMTAL